MAGGGSCTTEPELGDNQDSSGNALSRPELNISMLKCQVSEAIGRFIRIFRAPGSTLRIGV